MYLFWVKQRLLLSLAMIGVVAGLSAAVAAPTSVPQGILHHTEVVQGALRYDTEYPAINYSG